MRIRFSMDVCNNSMRVKNAVGTQFLFVFSELQVVFGFWWKFSLDCEIMGISMRFHF